MRFPSCRLVAILRDPVERAYSHYRMAMRRGQETRSFDDAIADDARGSRRARRGAGLDGARRDLRRVGGVRPGARRVPRALRARSAARHLHERSRTRPGGRARVDLRVPRRRRRAPRRSRRALPRRRLATPVPERAAAAATLAGRMGLEAPSAGHPQPGLHPLRPLERPARRRRRWRRRGRRPVERRDRAPPPRALRGTRQLGTPGIELPGVHPDARRGTGAHGR